MYPGAAVPYLYTFTQPTSKSRSACKWQKRDPLARNDCMGRMLQSVFLMGPLRELVPTATTLGGAALAFPVITTKTRTATSMSYREIKCTTRLLGIIVRPYSQISEKFLSRPRRPRRARPACCVPRRPRGIGSWSRETLYGTKTTLRSLYLAGTYA